MYFNASSTAFTVERSDARVCDDTGRVSLRSLLLTKDFRISIAWSCKIPQEKQRSAEEAARGTKEIFEETGAMNFTART